MATATATRTTGVPAAKKGTPVARRPFIAGTREIDRSYYDTTVTQTTSTQVLTPFDIPTNGFLSGVYLLVEATTAGNAAAVAFNADAPANAIDTIRLNDVQNQPLVGPMNGWDLAMINKYGGYASCGDFRTHPQYFALTGAGATGGSFAFMLRIPVEIVKRDALGALPNKNNSATFKVELTLANIATVYSVAPTAAPSIRVRCMIWGWDDPSDQDLKGNPVAQNPPAVNTTQYWQKQTYPLTSGTFNQRLNGLDGLIRGFIFVLDASGVRATGEANFPDPLTIKYEGKEIMNRLRTIWRNKIGEDYGFGRAPGGSLTAVVATEGAGQRDDGVYPLMFTKDFGLGPGAETRLTYLPMSSATTLELTGTIGGAGGVSHTLRVLVNKVIPAGGNPMAITGR